MTTSSGVLSVCELTALVLSGSLASQPASAQAFVSEAPRSKSSLALGLSATPPQNLVDRANTVSFSPTSKKFKPFIFTLTPASLLHGYLEGKVEGRLIRQLTPEPDSK